MRNYVLEACKIYIHNIEYIAHIKKERPTIFSTIFGMHTLIFGFYNDYNLLKGFVVV